MRIYFNYYECVSAGGRGESGGETSAATSMNITNSIKNLKLESGGTKTDSSASSQTNTDYKDITKTETQDVLKLEQQLKDIKEQV